MPVNITDDILILEQDQTKLGQAIHNAVAAVLQKYREAYLPDLESIPPVGNEIIVEDSLSKNEKRRYRAHIRFCQVLVHYQSQNLGEEFLRRLEAYLKQPNGVAEVPNINDPVTAQELAIAQGLNPGDDRFRFFAKMILLTLVAQRVLLLPMFSPNTFIPVKFGPEGNERLLDLLPRPMRELILTLAPRLDGQTSIDWTVTAGSKSSDMNRAGGDYKDWIPGALPPPVPGYAQSVGVAAWSDISEVTLDEIQGVYERAQAENSGHRAVILYLNCLFFCRTDDSAKSAFFELVNAIPNYRIYTEEFKIFAKRTQIRASQARNRAGKTPESRHLNYESKIRGLVRGYINGKLENDDFVTELSKVPNRKIILDFDQLSQFGPLPNECEIHWHSMMDQWKQAFALFKGYKRYEDEVKSLSEFTSFFTYLGVYLPAWTLKYPTSPITFPAKIHDFKGAYFVHRPEEIPIPGVDAPPLTFVQFNEKYNEGNCQETIATRVRVVKDMFAEIISGAELLGLPVDMNNPVRDSAVPSGGGRRYCSSKVAIPIPVAFLTLLYCYRILDCMEKINEELLGPNNLVLSRHLTTFVSSKNKTDGLRNLKDLKGFNIDTSAIFDGVALNFDVVPIKLFTLTEFPIKGIGDQLLLDTGPLEQIILMFETGLRGQSLQWMSTEFDKHITAREIIDQLMYPMHVNTDKAKKSAWTAWVSGRVINLLRKRREFRNRLDGEIFDQDIHYEDRDHTKWPKFKAVFAVNPKNGLPHSDSAYSDQFKTIFHALQRYIDQLGLNFVTSVPDEQSETGWRVDATPHSARKSVIMQHVTYLPPEYIGKYITGQSTRTVGYYAASNPDSFEHVDNHQGAFQIMDAARRAVDTSRGPQVTEPHKPGSALAKAFQENISRAMLDFGTMSTLILEKGTGTDVVQKGKKLKLAFEATHICPFGSQCPPERIKLGLTRRCNFCDFALRTVDHLPAIASEIRNILEESNSIFQKLDSVIAKPSEAQRVELEDRLRMFGEDLFSLSIADYCLRETLKHLKDEYRKNPKYFCFTPEIIVKNLEEVPFPQQDEGLAYVLGRLKESSTYFSLNDRTIKANIAKFSRRFMSGRISFHDLFEEAADKTAAEVYSHVQGLLSANNMTLDQLVDLLNQRVDVLAGPLALALPESNIASLVARSDIGWTL